MSTVATVNMSKAAIAMTKLMVESGLGCPLDRKRAFIQVKNVITLIPGIIG